MNIRASITVDVDDNVLYDCLHPETSEQDFGRASWKLNNEGGDTRIDVEAKDPTAFRAMMNSIIRALLLYEQAKQVK